MMAIILVPIASISILHGISRFPAARQYMSGNAPSFIVPRYQSSSASRRITQAYIGNLLSVSVFMLIDVISL